MRTCVLTGSELRELEQSTGPPSAEEAFKRAWPTIRSRARALGPGLLTVAVDDDGVAALLGVWARPDRPVTAIVGRHAATDLYLPDDPSLSLRHLAVLVLPQPPGAPVRYRVVDLRTGLGFEDEHHQRVEALEAEGPVFAHLGQYTLLMLPLTSGQPWPEDPDEAWAAVPPRTYRAAPDAREWLARRPPAPQDPRAGDTAVQVLPGPSFARAGRSEDGRLGMLRVASPHGATVFNVGARTARTGILLGRYDRCDNAGLRVLDDPNISRVHLLIADIDGALYAVDTGSTNGVRVDGVAFRERALGGSDRIELGYGLAEVEWTASH